MKKYTVENTVNRGFRADIVINGQPVRHVEAVWQIGPFVLARCLATDRAGQFVLTLDKDAVTFVYRFGFGHVNVSLLRG